MAVSWCNLLVNFNNCFAWIKIDSETKDASDKKFLNGKKNEIS